jgi:predicted ribosomally synthesized peptide with SipW-like signal peptide
MALCGSLIAGSTYALFTDTAEVNIAVTSGKVDVVAKVSDLATYSAVAEKNLPSTYSKSDEDKVEGGDKLGDYSGTYYYVHQTNAAGEDSGSFVNGGTASWNNTTSTLTLDKITPGDKVTFNISVANNSNVATKYRIKFYCDSETLYGSTEKLTDYTLFNSLNISLPVGVNTTSSDEDAATAQYNYAKTSNDDLLSLTTAWIDLSPATTSVIDTTQVTVELPITIGNEAQNRTCSIKYVVEAVQSNAQIGDNVASYEYLGNKVAKQQSTTVTAGNDTTVAIANVVSSSAQKEANETGKTAVTVKVPSSVTTTGEGSTSTATTNSLTVNVTEKTIDETISVEAGNATYSFDVTAYDEKGGKITTNAGESYYTISFKVPTSDGLVVYHKTTALPKDNGTKESNYEYYEYADGTITIYTKTLSPFVISYIYKYNGGEGTEASPYEINTVAQLKFLANAVNNGESYSGKYFELTSDLDLDGINWTPIGYAYQYNYYNSSSSKIATATNADNVFQGTFDGQDHTISNLTVIKDIYSTEENGLTLSNTNCQVGLFGYSVTSTVIKNVKINNVKLTGKEGVGALVGSAFLGTITSCHVTGTIQIEGSYKVGGLIGGGYATISDCSVTGTNISDTQKSYVKATYYQENANYTILGTGKDSSGNDVANILKGTDYEGDNVGGLIGYVGEGNLRQAAIKNDADEVTGYYAYVSLRISNCSVSNISVEGTRKVGGVVGYLGPDNEVYNISATNVDVKSNADTVSYKDSKNKTYVERKFIDIGGLIGESQHCDVITGTVKDCTVTGLICQTNTQATEAVTNLRSGDKDTRKISVTVSNVTVIKDKTNTERTTSTVTTSYTTDNFISQTLNFNNTNYTISKVENFNEDGNTRFILTKDTAS